MSDTTGKLRYAIYGGVVTAATIGLPVLDFLNCFCCAGVLLGGFLSVFFWTRDSTSGMPPPTSADAIQLGALSGVFGALFGSLLSMLTIFVLGDFMSEMLSTQMNREEWLQYLPPEFFDMLERMMSEHEPFSLMHMFGLLMVWLFVAPLFGTLGAMIGFALLRPKTPMAPLPLAGTSSEPPTNPPGG